MKNRLLLFAIPCLLLGACNNSPDRNSANDKTAVSAAVSTRDSLLKAAQAFHNQNAASDTGKKTDTINKTNPKKGNVD